MCPVPDPPHQDFDSESGHASKSQIVGLREDYKLHAPLKDPRYAGLDVVVLANVLERDGRHARSRLYSEIAYDLKMGYVSRLLLLV